MPVQPWQIKVAHRELPPGMQLEVIPVNETILAPRYVTKKLSPAQPYLLDSKANDLLS